MLQPVPERTQSRHLGSDMKFGEGWTQFFSSQVANRSFQKSANDVQEQRNAGMIIYPPEGKVFDSYVKTQLEDLKAVIMVDEHYSDPNLAGEGLALSISPDKPIPQVLMNVFLELNRDLRVDIPHNGNLDSWAEAGILLIANTITVQSGRPGSHNALGWSSYTSDLVKYISSNTTGVVFALWGTRSGRQARYIDKSKHTVLVTSDPSRPLEGFSGCGHFTHINKVTGLWS